MTHDRAAGVDCRAPVSAPVLVFGDDGSASADVAWLWANNQPWPGWSIRVVTGDAGPPPASSWGRPARTEAWTPPWGRRFFDASELASLEYVRSIDADPRLALDDQRDAAVVVVGRRGLGVTHAFWDISTSDWLAQYPSHPLLLVRSASVVRRVTCCVDGSADAEAALTAVLRLPLLTTAQITLLVVDDGHVDPDAALHRACELVEARGLATRCERVRGHAPQRVLEHLMEDRPDLLVLGTRGWTAWDRVTLGSTAARVVHHPSCNCLLAAAVS